MVEIPEHLLKRSREAMARAKGQAIPSEDEPVAEATPPESGGDTPASSAPSEATEAPAPAVAPAPSAPPPAAPAESPPAAAAPPAPAAAPPAPATGKPSGGNGGPKAGGNGGPVPSGGSGGGTGTKTAAPAAKMRTHRLLTVVKSGSIQQTKASPVDKVNVWPHLLAIEFLAVLACTAFLLIFSIFVNAPLLAEANYNKTPNPSKAPWYFLGLQELLAYFDPMIAGVTIPGMGLIGLMLAPYIDRNPSTHPDNRKFAIALFTYFMMFWSVLVIIGSFFRGKGYNFAFPWVDGIYFDL